MNSYIYFYSWTDSMRGEINIFKFLTLRNMEHILKLNTVLNKKIYFVFVTVIFLSCTIIRIPEVVGQGMEYPARYQPELENVTLDTYINNPRLFNIQVKCLLYDGPCDIVGRFLKRK